ncbi:MAG: NADPH-dependent FMN reductase [Patescibacteria group bacterium]
MASQFNIPVILGTSREGRRSEAPARYLVDVLKKRAIKTQLVDPRDYNCDPKLSSHDSDAMPKEFHDWQKIAQAADAFVIVAPEYNHGYPGVLKILLDELYEEYNYKPVAICGVSAGVLGGVRVVEQLRLVAIELKMVPIRQAVYFSNVKDLKLAEFDDRINKMLDELIFLAEGLKQLRSPRSSGQ